MNLKKKNNWATCALTPCQLDGELELEEHMSKLRQQNNDNLNQKNPRAPLWGGSKRMGLVVEGSTIFLGCH